MLIQLQRMDSLGRENLGALYIESSSIVAIYVDKPNDKVLCRVAVSTGLVYTVTQSISQVLEEIALRNIQCKNPTYTKVEDPKSIERYTNGET